ncbi:MAG: hypothetical protein MUE42_11265 [Opitutaceae bacterium]|nr:hypothetical protein [Opitutaceae bacterium]
MPLLEVSHLRTSFHTRGGVYRAVNDVSFSVERGEILGIVGESGSSPSSTSSPAHPAASRAAPPSSTASTCYPPRPPACARSEAGASR